MKSSLITYLICIMASISLSAQSETKINWLSWEEAMELSKQEKKKIFIEVYIDRCGWCKKMDATTFSEEHIVEYINANYYPIRFNAENKEPIELHGKSYKYIKSGKRGYHELANEIMMGKMSYPTVVFLNEDFYLIQAIPGYREADTFEMIMTYFAEDHHNSTPWKKYSNGYISKF